MKRSLLAVAFAAALVCALTFFFAPAANASSITLQPGETLNITADAILDLAGNSGSVHVADGVKLTVIDSANTGLSGEGAGKLTVLSGEVAAEAEDASGRRFLKLQNADGTFSFHPFYVTIKQVGINTYMNALCVQAMFVANEATQQAITTGVVYGDGALTNAAPTYDHFSFEDGVMYAYFDLIGSLDSQAAMEKVKSFRAYITVGGETIYSKTIATVSPLETLNTVSTMFGGFTEKQQNSLLSMIDRNPQLLEVPSIVEMLENKDLPKMTVTKNENPDIMVNVDTNLDGYPDTALPLSVQYTFVASKEETKYGDWIADFYVSIDMSETAEAYIAENGFIVMSIAGQYDINGSDWIPITLPIPSDVVDVPLLNIVTDFTFTYSDIQTLVSKFDCGVVGDEIGGPDQGVELTIAFRITEAECDVNGILIPKENGEVKTLGVFTYTYK